jgi:PmbA protein
MPYDADSASLLDHLLETARSHGAEAADASLALRESLSVEVRLGEIEGVEREESRSVALRALIGQRQAGAASTDLSERGLAELAARVVAMAKAAPEDPFCGLPDPTLYASTIPALDTEDAARPDAKALETMARDCEDAARAISGVTNSAGASAAFECGAFAYATSDGFAGSARGTTYSLSVSPLAERDSQKERDWEGRARRFLCDLPSAADIGKAAGERVVARLGARKLASRKAPVIYENRIARSLFGPFLGAISGVAVARGVSFLRGKLGQQVFAASVEIEDDPLKLRGLSSRPFDGEGVQVRRRTVIENGVLTTWLLNSAAARQLDMQTTGHATFGHGGPPGVGATNITVKPGEGDLAALMARAGAGLLVQETFSPSINPNTGDYSVGVAGQWFENGAPAYPVSEITVAGNLLDIYARLIPGGDMDQRGGLDAPSLLIDDLAIAGV